MSPAALPRQATAQSQTATLAGWQRHLQTALLDRRHGYGGLFFDRGVFRYLTPGMDHEYQLDVLTYAFTLAEDAAWYDQTGGYRAYMGSIDKSHFVTRHHIRHRTALSERVSFRINGIFQEDLTAQRAFVAPGLTYRWSDRHQIGLQQTIARYKPDLDLSLFYAYESNLGRLRLETTVLDVANNFIFDGLGVDPVLEDTTRSYTRRPWLFSLHLETPTWRNLRAEVAAGVQPTTRAQIGSQNHPARRFRWTERARYVGGLLEYRLPVRFGLSATAGLAYRHTFSAVRRFAPSGSAYTSNYRTRQVKHTATAYLLAAWRRLRAETWLSRGRYTDRQTGTDFDQASLPQALDYAEDRTKVRLRLRYAPRRAGPIAGLEYLALRRDFNDDYAVLEEAYFTFQQRSLNDRLVLLAGYQLASDARLLLGAAYDVDGDTFHRNRGPVRYDGGFARLTVGW